MSSNHSTFRNLKIIFCLLSTVIFLESCNWNSSGKTGKAVIKIAEEKVEPKKSAYVVDVSAMDYAFGIPEEIPSGWVTFRMKNMGKEEHVAVVAKFQDTVTFDRIQGLINEAISEGEYNSFEAVYNRMGSNLGGPALLSPDHTGETTVFLEPGVYSLSCGVKSADGVNHWQKGMIRAFKVSEKGTGAEKPEGTVNITLSNYAISTDQPIATGKQVFNVLFKDYDYHDVHLAKLAPGQKLEELNQWMNEVQVPSPYEFLGGAEQVPQGMSSTFTVDLDPGRYAFVSHGLAVLGMAEEFTVTETEKAPAMKNKPVNPLVTIESNLKGTKFPEKLNLGRTNFIIKNTGTEEYNYMFTTLKTGISEEEYLAFVKDFYVNENEQPEPFVYPDHLFFYKSIKQGEQEELNIDIEQRKYFLIGPLIPGKKWKAQWRENNMIHIMQGIEEKTSSAGGV